MLPSCACPQRFAGELREKLSSTLKARTAPSTHQTQVEAAGKTAKKKMNERMKEQESVCERGSTVTPKWVKPSLTLDQNPRPREDV